MPALNSKAIAALVVAAVVLLGGVAVRQRAPAAARSQPGLSAKQVRATFAFAPGVDPLNQQAILRAIAGARPEAQRLIAKVDGITTVDVGAAGPGAAGTTTGAGDHFEMRLDLGSTFRRLGQRGVNRLVLHELGHVVDFALVPAALHASLDGGIPAGVPCSPGTQTGGCAPREERFAETFAKWAMDDIGIDLFIGYAVPPPASLEAWAAPLARLG